MQSHLFVGRIILAVSLCFFNFVECSSCRGWTGIDGYCLHQYEFQKKNQVSTTLDPDHCNNITKNKNYHPCSFSSQSCVLVLLDDEWVSGCMSDNHGLFVSYDIDKSNQLLTPLKVKHWNTVSVGSFCTTLKSATECGQASVINTVWIHPDTTVCCCKTPACTDRLLRQWKEGRSLLNVKTRPQMMSFGIVVALGVVQAVMLSTALIALIHDYYSRYRVRVVIGEAEKTK